MKETAARGQGSADGSPPNTPSASGERESITGLPRWAIALIGLVVGGLALVVAVLLTGAFSFCGFSENHVATAYCAASHNVRLLLVATPSVTIAAGYAISVWTGRLTPIAIAVLCTLGAGLVALSAGY